MTSCLSADRLGMERAMLEAVVVSEVGRPDDIRRYLGCTLLNATNPPAEVCNPTPRYCYNSLSRLTDLYSVLTNTSLTPSFSHCCS